MPAGHVETDLITREELQLAARNHGMPLEALRYPITPVGLHYLLVHYDIPAVDPVAWRLEIGGLVEKAMMTFSLDDIRAMPATSLAVTMECAGNGRTALSPRPLSQPWILEAVGTGEWRGVSLRRVLEQAKPRADAREVVFTGLDHGLEGGIEQDYQRALSIADASRKEVPGLASTSCAAEPPMRPERCSRSTSPGRPAATRTTRSSG